MSFVDFSSILAKRERPVDSCEDFGRKLVKSHFEEDIGPHRAQIQMNGWVVRPSHVDMMDFVLDNLPSTWNPTRVAWVNLRNYSPPTSTNNTALTSTDHRYCGKWMWFVPECVVDEKFIMLAEALQMGLLGDSLKVPPVQCVQKFSGDMPGDAESSNHHQNHNSTSVASSSTATSFGVQSSGGTERMRVVPFIIYTKDFRDREDVLRVGLALRKLGIKKTISYKPGQCCELFLFTAWCIVCVLFMCVDDEN